MAFPLVPFVAGAVIGGLGAYFYRDEKLRKSVKRASHELPGKVKRTASEVSDKVSETVKDLRSKKSAKKMDAEPVVEPPAASTAEQSA